MPMKDYLYHGQAVGMHGEIIKPDSHVVDNHAKSGLPGSKPGGPYEGKHKAFAIRGILSYKRCYTSVHALPEDKGFFRTEVSSTVENLKILGDVSFSADRVSMGLVSVYRRQWYGRLGPQSFFARVLPIDCRFENVLMNGIPIMPPLPAPFTYTKEKREAYLTADDLDKVVDAQVRDAIATSPTRFVYIPNFGRIFFGEWTITPGDIWQPVHQISMVRLAMGSPVAGHIKVHTLEGGGHPTPP